MTTPASSTSASLVRRLRERVSDPMLFTDELHSLGPNAPADPETLAQVEEGLGLRLPDLLRQIYLEVGDGNWGPGYGLLPLKGESYASSAGSLLDESRATGTPGQVFLCYWGCTVFSVLDSASGRVGIVDVGTECSDQVSWQASSVEEWFEAWLSGKNLFFDVEDA
ncbi:SMI1/KNR4 family protein [Deinococcus altitudinis]|uniref:SMI1/KNR4 family protein n=1 Tax=Deinococcus altitudinis TaxID=468914 RepID=UPI003891EAAD